MDANTYQIIEVDCQQGDCNLKFNVVTSSIDTVIAGPAEEVDLKASIKNTTTKLGTITDYIVVECPSGHKQRVFLKSNKS